LIVRIVEAFTPNDVDLPQEIQDLKKKIKEEKIDRIAQAAADNREEENSKFGTVLVPEARRLSIKRRATLDRFEEAFTPR